VRFRVRDLQPRFGRGLDIYPVATEDQQIQVDLARTPALALLTAHRLLDSLEGGE
jgi:hypothetical protein